MPVVLQTALPGVAHVCPLCGANWYRRHSCVPPELSSRRPWFWWLALGIVAALFAVEFWLVYRAVAGWPVEGLTLLTRMAG